jgi:hypothetical protein
MSRDLTDVMFDFSQPFEINDDNTILKRLGMDKTNRQTLAEMLPEELLAYATITAAAAAAVAGGAGPADYHPVPAFM